MSSQAKKSSQARESSQAKIKASQAKASQASKIFDMTKPSQAKAYKIGWLWPGLPGFCFLDFQVFFNESLIIALVV
jgi:hypothetical protein